MSDRKKKKHDTRMVLSNEQIKILEIEYEHSKFISIERQKELAEEFNVKVYLITGWFLERLANDQYQAREKTELGPNSINLNENASSSSSLFTTATPVAGLQSVDSRLTASPAAHATSSGSNDFCYDLHTPHVSGNLPNDPYLPSHHNMTFLSVDGVGPTSVTSQGNISRSGQVAVADPTLTSDEQNTTPQPQSSNQQGVLLKKEVQHRPDYSDFEKRKSVILSHLNSFTSKELITKKMKRIESNRHELETSHAAKIMKHTQGSFDEHHRIHSSYHGQSSHQRQVSDDAATSSSYSEMASFTNSALAEEIPFDCRDQDFTMKQLDFLEDEFVYWESLQPLRLWYISCALKVPEWMVERWFEIRRKSIKQTTKRKFPTSASNTQSTDLEEEPKKPSRKRWAYSDEQNAGLQVAYDESRFLTNERTFALAIYFVIPLRRVENWFHNRTRILRGAYLKQKRLEEIQQNKQSTSSSSLAALPSSHIHRQDPSQQDGNELDYLDGNLTKKIDQSNELAPLDVYDVIHVLGDQQDDANEPI